MIYNGIYSIKLNQTKTKQIFKGKVLNQKRKNGKKEKRDWD